MAKSRALGRGLSSLIPHNEYSGEPTLGNETSLMPINQLVPNPYQPRKRIDPESLDALADSIKNHGIIQPILIRKTDSGHEIVAGERRWRAARIAGLKEIPVHILSLSNSQTMELALVENIQREDLNALDVALGINELIKKFSLTHEQVAQKLGWSRAAVTNKLRLLQLPEEVAAFLLAGDFTEGHARTLLAIPNPGDMIRIAQLAISESLNVRQIEEEVRNFLDKGADISREITGDNTRMNMEKLPLPLSSEILKLCRKNKVKIRFQGDEKSTKLTLNGLEKWQADALLGILEKGLLDVLSMNITNSR